MNNRHPIGNLAENSAETKIWITKLKMETLDAKTCNAFKRRLGVYRPERNKETWVSKETHMLYSWAIEEIQLLFKFSAAFIKRQNKMQYFAIETHLQSQRFAIICDFIAKSCNIFNPLFIAYSVRGVGLGDYMKSIATFCVLEMQ